MIYQEIKFTWLIIYEAKKPIRGCDSRGQLKCDGKRAETRFRLSAKRMSPFKSAGTSVQSIAGSLGVRISGSNAGYTMFLGSVKGTGYPLYSPVSLHLPSRASPCVITFQLESTSGICHLAIHPFTTLRKNLGGYRCKDQGKAEAFVIHWLVTLLSAGNKMPFLR